MKDKILLISKWFSNNNHLIKTNTYDSKLLLNKLCFYTKAMFLALDKNINQKTNKLTKDEIKILQIINRVYGYSNQTYEEDNNFLKEEMLELYEYYKDEEFKEKLEIINGRYFFIAEDVTLTEEEYKDIYNSDYNDDNITYYVSRDDEGYLMVY